MPWLSIPLGDKRKEELSDLYEIEGIPTLIIIEPATGTVINTGGVDRIQSDPLGAEFPWFPKPAYNIDQAPGEVLNTKPVFLAYSSEISDDFVQTFERVAESKIAQWEQAGEEQKIFFIYATSNQSMYGRLAQFLNLTTTAPLFILLNLSIQQKAVLENADYSEDGVNAFIEAYEAGALDFVHFKA